MALLVRRESAGRPGGRRPAHGRPRPLPGGSPPSPVAAGTILSGGPCRPLSQNPTGRRHRSAERPEAPGYLGAWPTSLRPSRTRAVRTVGPLTGRTDSA